VLAGVVQRQRPDVLISTYPPYHPALWVVLSRAQRPPALLTVVTDLGTVHPLWFLPRAQACLVATDTVRRQATACGVPPARVHITGLPVDPRLCQARRERAALRAELGWAPSLPTVLAVGSRRVARFGKVLRAIDQLQLPLQLAVVAGGDEALFAQLQQTNWRGPVHRYNWVDNLPALMQAADCVMSKAGGLIIAEALACGLPILLVDHLPDQERGNAAWLVGSGAGALALDPHEAADTLRRWLDGDGQELAQRAARAAILGRPRAAYAVAEHAWRAAEGRV
jgi:UDP-N-acetylglucosamine:LPS N-acetylglucosamine transferase